jgi:hypothetical protein
MEANSTNLRLVISDPMICTQSICILLCHRDLIEIAMTIDSIRFIHDFLLTINALFLHRSQFIRAYRWPVAFILLQTSTGLHPLQSNRTNQTRRKQPVRRVGLLRKIVGALPLCR